MQKSLYQDRARRIHGEKFKDQTKPKDIPASEYWDKYVKNKEDVSKFYKLYYPQLPDIMADAIADFIYRYIEGKIPPSAEFLRGSKDDKERYEKHWNYEEDIERERMEALMKITAERLEKLMEEYGETKFM